jgi:hypothetical protein
MPELKAPRGTGRAGRTLWSAVLSTYDLEEHELQVLAQVATVAD